MNLTNIWHENEFVCIDMQGSGPNYKEDEEICEIGAVIIKNGNIGENSFYKSYTTKNKIPDFILNIHKDTANKPKNNINSNDIADFFNFIGNRIIVVHNPYPERRLLGKIDSKNNTILIIDTLKLAKKIFPNLGTYSLENLSKYLGIKNTANFSNCLLEAEATANILIKLVDKLPDSEKNLDYLIKVSSHEILKKQITANQ